MSIAVSDSYLALIHAFPLHPLRNARDYNRAAAVLDALAVRDEGALDPGERDYLEMLEMLLDEYDERNFHIGADHRSPHQRLRHLMDQVGMKSADLMKVLGASQSLVSLILNGKRELSKPNIRKLADHFRVDASYFL